MLVSVIIPNYNREELVLRAVKSVLRQSYNNIEVIVVDDCSTDSSVNRLSTIKDRRVKVIQLSKNCGACVARNIGIKNAKGDYLAFLDSDDIWHADKLKRQIKYLEINNFDVAASSYIYHASSGTKRIKPGYAIQENDIVSRIIEKNIVTTGTILARRECFDNIEFDILLPRYQDWDVAIQLSVNYKMGFLHEPTMDMYEQKKSITNSTSYKKKYAALIYIYSKYLELFKKNRVAESQILWTIGMYSLYLPECDKKFLKKSLEVYPQNTKRKIIYKIIELGGKRIIKKLYGIDH